MAPVAGTVAAALVLGLVLASAPLQGQAASPFRHTVACTNASHYHLRPLAASGFRAHPSPPGLSELRGDRPCPAGTACVPHIRAHGLVTGACRAATLSAHLLNRTVGYQIVEQVPAAEAAGCSASPQADAAQGKMLCEALHGTAALQPTFGHELGNTWLTFPGAGADRDNCVWANASGWRDCVGRRVAHQAALLTAASPGVVISAGLMEYLDRRNLDNASAANFQACCVPGSIGQWSGPDTCVPDIKRPCAQGYYIQWGKTFLDAGCRAFFFGQARLTGGGRQCNPDGTGCSRVSTEAAAGFGAVIAALRAHATEHGLGPTWYGPQAASGFELANGTELADWVYGAQHLHARGQWLVQPFGRNGSHPRRGEQWYGSGDWHDANRMNNAKGLPVLLDFDNFSGDEAVPDDIRRLSAWPNATRPALIGNLWLTARLYSPLATVAIPLSKAAGGNWPAFNQSQCWSQGADGIFFGAYSCAIVAPAAALFAAFPSRPIAPARLLAAVDLDHLGTSLQSPDLTCVWAFATLLGRDFANHAEYATCVKALPDLVLGARGARCQFAARVTASPEFRRECTTDACLRERVTAFLCLGQDALCGRSGALDLAAVCNAVDAVGLFGNAALIDPMWRL